MAQAQLEAHGLNGEEDLREHKCDSCPKKYAFWSNLLRHQTKEHNRPKKRPMEGPYVCGFCERSYDKYSSFKGHITSKHGGMYKCDRCGNTSSRGKKELEQHMVACRNR